MNNVQEEFSSRCFGYPGMTDLVVDTADQGGAYPQPGVVLTEARAELP